MIKASSSIRCCFDHASIPAFFSFVGFRNIIDRPTKKAQNVFAQCSYLGACVLTLYHLWACPGENIGCFWTPPPLPLRSVPKWKKAIEPTRSAVSWNCSFDSLGRPFGLYHLCLRKWIVIFQDGDNFVPSAGSIRTFSETIQLLRPFLVFQRPSISWIQRRRTKVRLFMQRFPMGHLQAIKANFRRN